MRLHMLKGYCRQNLRPRGRAGQRTWLLGALRPVQGHLLGPVGSVLQALGGDPFDIFQAEAGKPSHLDPPQATLVEPLPDSRRATSKAFSGLLYGTELVPCHQDTPSDSFPIDWLSGRIECGFRRYR
jgi:hypothetical protein